jgi:hypothetical protein
MTQKQITEQIENQTCYIKKQWFRNVETNLLDKDQNNISKLTDKQYESICNKFDVKEISADFSGFTSRIYSILNKK